MVIISWFIYFFDDSPPLNGLIQEKMKIHLEYWTTSSIENNIHNIIQHRSYQIPSLLRSTTNKFLLEYSLKPFHHFVYNDIKCICERPFSTIIYSLSYFVSIQYHLPWIDSFLTKTNILNIIVRNDNECHWFFSNLKYVLLCWNNFISLTIDDYRSLSLSHRIR